MKTLKFKAWDTWNKKMFPVSSIEWDGIFIRKAIVRPSMDRQRNYAVMAENLVLLQFTGFYDQSDQEIYDGDIWAKGKDIYIAKMDEELGCWRFKDGEKSLPISDAINGEVIGNLHSHPELLL